MKRALLIFLLLSTPAFATEDEPDPPSTLCQIGEVFGLWGCDPGWGEWPLPLDFFDDLY